MTLTSPNAFLLFSHVGYDSLEVAVNNRSSVNVILKPRNLELEDVVVIGYAQVKRKI
ncbi:hypothetical protein [Paraflavitalea speifideaquila]|uniref:hypothetical protein n=1 Tax=Paraflavitalea speifideaquila TaxID=3076558 RepID=UPI0028E67590|nr:hypothetical protein [Paraflavitalea speifideiaquila]